MKKIILTFIVLSLAVPFAVFAHGGSMMDFDSVDDNFGMMPGFGFMGGGGIFFWLIFLVWLVVGILAIIWFAKKIWK